jgi:hypothetical protein
MARPDRPSSAAPKSRQRTRHLFGPKKSIWHCVNASERAGYAWFAVSPINLREWVLSRQLLEGIGSKLLNFSLKKPMTGQN